MIEVLRKPREGAPRAGVVREAVTVVMHVVEPRAGVPRVRVQVEWAVPRVKSIV